MLHDRIQELSVPYGNGRLVGHGLTESHSLGSEGKALPSTHLAQGHHPEGAISDHQRHQEGRLNTFTEGYPTLRFRRRLRWITLAQDYGLASLDSSPVPGSVSQGILPTQGWIPVQVMGSESSPYGQSLTHLIQQSDAAEGSSDRGGHLFR